MLGYIILLIGALICFADLYFFIISLGFRKNRCGICKGYLTNTAQHKDIYVGGKNGKFYKRYIDYVYVYRVNGTQYYISGGTPGVKGNLPRSADIVYHKKNPKFAYIKRITFPLQPIWAVILFPVWVLLSVIGLILIFP